MSRRNTKKDDTENVNDSFQKLVPMKWPLRPYENTGRLDTSPSSQVMEEEMEWKCRQWVSGVKHRANYFMEIGESRDRYVPSKKQDY